MTPRGVSKLLVVAGLALVSAGAFVIHLAAGLVVAGAALGLCGLTLVEVDE